jgi:hypothetical protein
VHSTKPATFARDRRKANDDGRHEPALIVNQPNVRRTCFREIGLTRDEAWAQAMVDASTGNVLTATGVLDASAGDAYLAPGRLRRQLRLHERRR